MNKLVILVDGHYTYVPYLGSCKGMLQYLKNLKALTNPITKKVIDTVEVSEAYRVKLYTKYRKIEVTGNIQSDNQVLSLDDKNTFYIIFSNRVKNKSVPENVAVICSELYINQDDGQGGIYKIYTPCLIDVALARLYEAISVTKVLSKQHVKLKEAINLQYKSTGDFVYYTSCFLLLENLGRCKTTKTKTYLTNCVTRLLTMGKNKFDDSSSNIFTRLNDVVRDGKMSTANMLSYKGFKFFNRVIDKFEKTQKEVNKKQSSYNFNQGYLERFTKGLLSVMLATELKCYLKVGDDKVLYLNNDTEILFKEVESVLPHMETYVGYLVVANGCYFGQPKLTMYREHTNKYILDYIRECKDIRSKEMLEIVCIFDNDRHVERYLPN